MKRGGIYAGLDIHLNSASFFHKLQLDLREREIYGYDTVEQERLTSCGTRGDWFKPKEHWVMPCFSAPAQVKPTPSASGHDIFRNMDALSHWDPSEFISSSWLKWRENVEADRKCWKFGVISSWADIKCPFWHLGEKVNSGHRRALSTKNTVARSSSWHVKLNQQKWTSLKVTSPFTASGCLKDL